MLSPHLNKPTPFLDERALKKGVVGREIISALLYFV
jgi:hypothetical protein